ncbi:MAG: translation initiation factor 2 [Clostridium sp.]|nr:translation initiation factor 2 [Clostridium sp.]MCM1172282.1 translation initiation factor 2 [Clostridium sp.]MCM1208705.1 translation initiation factor 2 [Ruminococcus sp.]
MRGKHKITISNNFVQYRFEICRNITVIKGDSATGKTTLVDMIREYYENGEQSGVSLSCDKKCMTLEGKQWEILLEQMHDTIVFIDEGNSFISSNEFSEMVKNSDNYYVIVTREKLPNLPYSVDEIYGIKTSGKYGALKKTYNEFYRIYGDLTGKSFEPSLVLVEDSNSGYEFFEEVSKGYDWDVFSAGGKTKIFDCLQQNKDKNIIVIADGAAFGSEIDQIMKLMQYSKGILLYLPESFEWLILKSNIFNDKIITNILENPSDYIDSEKYMSWERFFTALLVEKTNGSYLKYSKNKLNKEYRDRQNLEKIMEVIPNTLLQ